MTLPVQNELVKQPGLSCTSKSKRDILNDARAEALRQNLKKRKDQASARKTNDQNQL